MKRKWEKLKAIWWDLWGIYEDDDDTTHHLSRSDKVSIWYGSFIMSMTTVTICILVIVVSNIRISRQNAQDMDDILNVITTYLATATKDEYDKIAETIRHDLIFSEYNKDMENLLQYIPNTSENCPTCRESYPAQAFLVCFNTGELYSLDLFDKGEGPGMASSGMRMSFGYDEISETRIRVTKHNVENSGYAEICRERKIVSAQRMKAIFCDDCIREILNTVNEQIVGEVVLFDAEKKIFYPIEAENIIQIGDYKLTVGYNYGDYRIDIKYNSQ